MKRIGIISDTHGYWDERYEQYLGECDEIWHRRHRIDGGSGPL